MFRYSILGFSFGCFSVYVFCSIFLQPTDYVFFTYNYFRGALLVPVLVGGLISGLMGCVLCKVKKRTVEQAKPRSPTELSENTWPPPPRID